MGCPSTVVLDGNLVFSVCTHNPETGILTDADAVPTYRVYEEETTTPILTGNLAKLDDANTTGFYSESIACTTANGFEIGKSYSVYIQAVVAGYTGAISYSFGVVRAAMDSTVSVVSAVSGSVINVYRGTTWSISLTVGSIVGYSKLYFSIKSSIMDADSAAIVQIEKAGGLLVLNGSSVGLTTTDGAISVASEALGTITITLKPASSTLVAPVTGISYDVKCLVGAVMTMMADGRNKFSVIGDVTRRIA